MKLLSQLRVDKSLVLKNRIAMAPMTRSQSGPQRVPGELVAKYYTQRASAGLIFTEATTISSQANGWACTPGLYKPEMVEAWKKVNDKVHKSEGVIFAQLWHMGRASHSSFQVNNQQIVSASAIAISDVVRNAEGTKVPCEVPRALSTEEVARVVEDYVKAAENAKIAGFDGIELHGANGYLIDQFLQSCTNARTDKYGGSIENRVRFLIEIVEGVSTVFPRTRISVRLSPNSPYGGMGSADNIETFAHAMRELQARGVGILHVMDGLGFGFHQQTRPFTLADARKEFSGIIIGNVGYTKETAEQAIESGNADMIAFGRAFITSPDIAERFKHGHPLAPPASMSTWYGGLVPSEAGYTEYSPYSPTR